MKPWSHTQTLSEAECGRLHEAALRILREVGFVVENTALLDRLAAAGASVERAEQKALFSRAFVERFLDESDRHDWTAEATHISGHAGVYFGHYLDPETGEYLPWDTQRLLGYLKLAHHLPNTNPSMSVIVPLEDVAAGALVPYYHYLTFKHFGRSACSLDEAKWSPCIWEMCQAASEEMNVPAGKVFSGYVFTIPPLRLGRQEAEVLQFWLERGLEVHIHTMTSAGGTAPVTLAGALALHLAHGLVSNILARACFGRRNLVLDSSISHLDMRTGMFPYGRPERALVGLAMADMARFYGAHCGIPRSHTDAKYPSAEAGYQKALEAVALLMATGSARVSCGQLSVDEIFSPVQMVIDDEFVAALKFFAEGFEVNDETLAVDIIKGIGPGGQFMDADHTVRHFRRAAWQPRVFSREMFAGWRQAGRKGDVDRAREICRELARRDPLPPCISDRLERRLLDLVHKHSGRRCGPVSAV